MIHPRMTNMGKAQSNLAMHVTRDSRRDAYTHFTLLYLMRRLAAVEGNGPPS